MRLVSKKQKQEAKKQSAEKVLAGRHDKVNCVFFMLNWCLHPSTSRTSSVRADASKERDELCGRKLRRRDTHCRSVAPVAYQVILEPGIGQFREFEPRRVHTRINSLGLFLVDKLTCGKRESVS